VAPVPARDFSGSLEALYGSDHAAAREAAEAIANEPRAMDHFSALLQSGRLDWRLTALHGLALSRDRRVADELLKAIGDAEPKVRAAAARALRGRGGTAAVQRLQEILRDEEEEGVKSAVMEALREYAGERN
jgi:hypothetical protein